MTNLDHDIDGFGIVEPHVEPHAEPHAEPHVEPHREPATAPKPAVSAEGHHSVATARDYWRTTINVIGSIGAQANPRRRKGHGKQDQDSLQLRADRYVPPAGLLEEDGKSALCLLRDNKVLLLTCREHLGGQYTAGLRLGHALQAEKPGLVVREEIIDRLPSDDVVVTDEPAVVLADLRDSEDALQSVRQGLVAFVDELKEHHSYLVLIIPPHQMREFDEFLPGKLHVLGKPAATEVLRRHLPGVDAQTALSGDLLARFEAMWPPEIKKLADTVSDRTGPGGDPALVLHDELAGKSGNTTAALRATILSRQNERDTEWLALLASATLLEGCSPRHIVSAGDELLRLNEVPVPDTPPLLRPSPHTRLLALAGDGFDQENREFRSPGFAPDVLRHLWREHDDLHPVLAPWIAGIPRHITDFTSLELEHLADRCAEIATEAGAGIALTLAAEWARTNTGDTSDGTETSSHPSARYRRSVAVRLLTTTAADPLLGKKVRDQLREWSIKASADLKVLTAEVCAGIGPDYPGIALTRLKHLAGSHNGSVRTAVLTAMRQLGRDLGADAFLRHLEAWFDRASPERLAVLAASVADVLAGDPEGIDPGTATWFWRQALDTMAPEHLRPLVTSWLSTAATAPGQHGDLVEPLVQATESTLTKISLVHYASRHVPANAGLDEAATARLEELVARLHTRLDEVDPIWNR